MFEEVLIYGMQVEREALDRIRRKHSELQLGEAFQSVAMTPDLSTAYNPKLGNHTEDRRKDHSRPADTTPAGDEAQASPVESV